MKTWCMDNEDYVSFETATLLKEKGFNWNTDKQFNLDKIVSEYNITDRSRYPERYLDAPTIQMVVKWLREKKGIAIIPVLNSILDNEKFLWDIKIVVAKTGERYSQGWTYEKQEDAFDTAIKYCLENLV